MKLKDLDFINGDYIKLENQFQEDNSSFIYSDINTYFDKGANRYVELGNSSGIVYANEYVEFVSSTLFPFDGSWVTTMPTKGKEKEALKLADLMNDRLCTAGFYKDVLKLIKEGALYNTAMLQTMYDGGLYFDCIKNESIFMHKSSNPSTMRAYAKKQVTAEEIINTCEGTVVMDLKEKAAQSLQTIYDHYWIVEAILPMSEVFYKKANKSKFKFKKETFVMCEGRLQHVTKIGESDQYYSSFPIMCYLPNHDTSLAELAVTAAKRANRYEVKVDKFAGQVISPAIGLASETFANNAFSLDERGLVPLNNYDRLPTPIESAQRFPITSEEIQRHESKIREVFKTDIIRRVNITNLSQGEMAANKLNAIMAVMPAASDLIAKIPKMVLTRAHELLKKHDKEYRDAALSAGDVDFKMSGVSGEIRNLKTAVGISRLAQAITPYVQIDPSSAQMIDGDATVRAMAQALGVPVTLADEEAVEAEREAAAKQQEIKQKQEQETVQGDSTLKEAQAEKALADASKQPQE